MTALTSLARIMAAESGRAQPITTVRHVHVAARPLVFVPLTLAGEANAPLAAMVGADRELPQILIVGEPRDRTERFAFAARLAGLILPYLTSHEDDAPQIAVPGLPAAAFTRLLGRSTRFRRTDGDYPVPACVPLLGRWLTFFTERCVEPGSSLLLPITAALAGHWATGQSAAEDLNLAALMGWVDPPAGMTGADAARLAEDPVRCPPAGPTTDPTFDNEVLAELLAAVREARATGRGYDRAMAVLTQALTAQMAPTWVLVWRAIDLLRDLPEATHTAARWAHDREAFSQHARYVMEGGVPQPKHDSAVAAAARLARLERIQEMVEAQRAFDDPLVMAEYRMIGAAFAGRVVAAEPDRLDHSGRKRILRPRITIQTSEQIPGVPGATLTSPARQAQEARIVEVSGEHVVLELKGGMGRSLTPQPGSVPAVGEMVCYAAFDTRFTPPPKFPAREQTPWTHGGPPPEYIPDAAADDPGEEWS